MKHMPRQIEGQRLLQGRDPGEVASRAGLVEPLDRGVRVLYICRVMFAVMKLQDFARNVGLKRAVTVSKFGKSVF